MKEEYSMEEVIIKDILESIKLMVSSGIKEEKLTYTRAAIEYCEVFKEVLLTDITHDLVYYEILSYLINQESRAIKIQLKIP